MNLSDSIKAVLIEMAINDQLPSDLTQLDMDSVMKKAKESTAKEYKLFTAAGSDEEGDFEELKDFDAAVEFYEKDKEKYFSVAINTFNTEEERESFLLGFQAGIGWGGEGKWFKNTKK